MNWRKILKELKNSQSQAELAKQLGYSQPTISRVLNGKRGVSTEMKERIVRSYPKYLPQLIAEILKEETEDAS